MTSLASRQDVGGSRQASRSNSQAQDQQQKPLTSSMTEDELTFLKGLASGGPSSASTSVDRRKGGKIEGMTQNDKAKTWGPERLKEMKLMNGGNQSPGAKSVTSEKTQAKIDSAITEMQRAFEQKMQKLQREKDGEKLQREKAEQR